MNLTKPIPLPLRAPNGRDWNFLVMYGDDWPLAAWSYMPQFNASRYASRFISFTNSDTEQPLCFPSRATWQTGQSCRYTGVVSNNDGNTYAAKALSTTIMSVMKNAGYRTSWVGKVYNGLGTGGGGGWGTLPWFHPGVDDMCGQWGSPDYFDWDELQSNGTTVHHGFKDTNQPGTDYSTDVEKFHILSWLQGLPRGQKWFINWPTKGVHGGGVAEGDSQPPARYVNQPMALVEDPLTFGIDPRTYSIPGWATAEGVSPWDDAAIAAVRATHLAAARSMLAVDEALVTVLNYLQDSDQLNNTIVMVACDNAHANGELRLSGKGTPHVSGSALLLKVMVPGIAGGTCYAPVSNYDLAPTLVALSGATPLHPYYGMSIHPLFTNPNASWRQAIFEVNLSSNPKFRAAKFGGPLGRKYYRTIAGGQTPTSVGGWNDPSESQNVIFEGDAAILAALEASVL